MLSRIGCMFLATMMCGSVLAEYRVWKGQNGSVVEAEMVSVKEGTVSLRRRNGDVVNVPIAKLSTEDADYIKKVGKPEGETKAFTVQPVVYLAFDKARLGLDSAGGKSFPAQQLTMEKGGRRKGAASFNGLNSALNLNKPLPLQNQPCTIAVWFKTSCRDYQEIFSYGATVKGCCLYTDGHKIGAVYRWNSGANFKEFYTSKMNADSGEWHHVCFSIDQDGSATLYGDGKKLLSRNISLLSADPLAGARLGQSVNGSVSGEKEVLPFNGILDEFLWFDVALSSEQAQQLYDSYP